jgi:hypothetical protein
VESNLPLIEAHVVNLRPAIFDVNQGLAMYRNSDGTYQLGYRTLVRGCFSEIPLPIPGGFVSLAAAKLASWVSG